MTVDSSCGTAAEKERGEERSPDRWMVVLLNDDYTPFDWVIDVLIRIFERTPGDAMAVTRSVHQQAGASQASIRASRPFALSPNA